MNRGYVDDAAATALLDHLPGRDLRAEKGALEIDRHYPVVLLFGGLEDRGARLHAGIIYHDIDPAEPTHRLVDEHLHVGESAHIGFDPNRLITELGYLPLQRLCRFRMTHVVNYDIRLLASEFEDNCL